ncbi:MAG: signal peptidase I [Candidatus Dojkabacteria bacterium]
MNNPESNPFYQEAAKPVSNKKVLTNIITVVAVIAITLLVSWFTILGQNLVDGPSMRSNFYTGDFLMINRFPAILGEGTSKSLGIDYERGDIVVLQEPGLPEFVKRVMAKAGEEINIDKGRVFINGKVMVEDYLPENLYTNGGSFLEEGAAPYLVPSGYIVAIGDNRPESNDSRFIEIGPIKREWIKGKVFLRIWPSNAITFIPRGTFHFVDASTYDFSKADPDFRHPLTRSACTNLAQCW